MFGNLAGLVVNMPNGIKTTTLGIEPAIAGKIAVAIVETRVALIQPRELADRIIQLVNRIIVSILTEIEGPPLEVGITFFRIWWRSV